MENVAFFYTVESGMYKLLAAGSGSEEEAKYIKKSRKTSFSQRRFHFFVLQKLLTAAQPCGNHAHILNNRMRCAIYAEAAPCLHT